MYLTDQERKYWLSYNKTGLFKFADIRKIIKQAGSLEKSWQNRKILSKLKGLKSKLRKSWKLDPDKLMAKLKKSRVEATTIVEENFPRQLKQIKDKPFLIYYRGKLPDFKKENFLASVGTRKNSSYGKTTVFKLVAPCAKNGLVIVSGLAYGIDKYSHRACLKESGLTVAVLGSGVDKKSIYPAAHRGLADKIVESGGLLVSEYFPGVRPRKHHFVARNRLIAGLSRAVLIVEAPKKSGALITAEFALEEGREVLAVPGNIDSSNSAGTNSLIKEGAVPITRVDDIYQVFDIKATDSSKPIKLKGKEKKIFELLSKEPLTADKLSQKADLDLADLSVILTKMEIKGLAKKAENNKYQTK